MSLLIQSHSNTLLSNYALPLEHSAHRLANLAHTGMDDSCTFPIYGSMTLAESNLQVIRNKDVSTRLHINLLRKFFKVIKMPHIFVYLRLLLHEER